MTNELKVGLAVLLSAAFIFFGVRFLSGQPLFGAGYTVVVVFEDAQGLAPGALVRLNGVRVGDVRDVRLGTDARRVFVDLSIDGDVEIPRGSTVQTSGISALGEVNIEITPPQGASAGNPLAPGDTLIASTTPDIFDLIAGESNSLTARADTALIGAVNTFTTLDRILQNSGGDIESLLAQLRFLSQASVKLVTEEQGRIDRTLASLEGAAANAGGVADRVGRNVEDLSVIVGNDVVATSGTVRLLAETNADSVTAAVNNLSSALRRADQQLVQLTALTETLTSLTAGLDSTLNSPNGTVGLLLRDPSLYYNLNATATSIQQILQDLQADPGRYLGELDGVVKVF
ncbi:MlaD family protein [Rubrivirga sp. IMCC43871]|uniref:MlaD family protein n=1 Tax=Rubrivirga sp. IMCC43871 TaxID=3391575 RepID=UPI00398FCFCB